MEHGFKDKNNPLCKQPNSNRFTTLREATAHSAKGLLEDTDARRLVLYGRLQLAGLFVYRDTGKPERTNKSDQPKRQLLN